MKPTSTLIGKKATAELLGISVGLLEKLVRQRRIEPVRLGKRVLFRRDDVERLALTPSQQKVERAQPVGPVQ